MRVTAGESPKLRRRAVTSVGRLGVGITLVLGLGGGAALAIGGLGAPTGAAVPAVTPTIWVVNQDASTLISYPLSATGNASPAVSISANQSSLEDPFGTEAFNDAGDLWVSNLNNHTLVEYTQSQLASSGDPTPAVTISSNASSLGDPGSVAFDASGDLWALNESGTLVEYTPSQLAASGDPVPAVTISVSISIPDAIPYGFAFDTSGDLWVSNIAASTVVEFTPSQLAASGAPTPAVTISATSASLDNPSGVAFDASGDLWVTNTGTDTLVEYSPSQLAASGDPAPAVTISSNASSLDGPFSLAFDAAGDLWVPNAQGDSIVEYTPGQLAASGDPVPIDTIVGSNTGLNVPGGVAIEQAPTVTSVSPASGPPAGGTTVTVDGTGFIYGATVDFGSVPATSVTYANPYELTAVAPAGSGTGTVDVTVSTFAGTSATSSADQFTYTNSGYVEVASDGGVFNYGSPFYGSRGGQHLNAPVVGIAGDPATGGYWEVAADGGVFGYNAPFFGSRGGQPLNAPIVGIAATPDGGGYWLVAKDGGVFNYGDAKFYGSRGGQALNAPVVGIAADNATGGYWEVAADGGIFNYNAPFLGSRGGQHLNAPVVGIAASTGGGGYWLVAKDGGIFNYGAAGFLGSRGGQHLNAPVVGVAGDPATGGYWEVAADGGIFNYGAPFLGSRGGQHLNAPVVGLGAA